MANEPDVFKKLEALLNKHKNGEVAPSAEQHNPIPVLLDEIEEPEPFPVLTQMVGNGAPETNQSDDTIEEFEIELDLEFIPDELDESGTQSVLSAELPEVWEQYEDEFDAETTHGFGLSAFSRQAAEAGANANDYAATASELAAEAGSELAPAPAEDSPPSQAPAPHIPAPTERDPLVPEVSGTKAHLSAKYDPELTDPAMGPVGSAAPEPEASDSPLPPEFALNDTLTERALRDLDRHVAAILERQVGPQLAQRLDQALASMLAQFSTNLESLVRDAVRDEMRRFFDGENQ